MSAETKVEKPKPGCIIAIIVVLILIVWKCNSPSEEEIKKEESDKAVQELMLKIDKENDSISKLPPLQRILNAHKSLSKDEIYDADITKFEKLVEDLKNTEYSKRILKSLDSLKSVKEIQSAKKTAELEKETIQERKEYETTLRNSFLDNNLDIKVSVYGKNNTKIKLTYALFSDVWFRKFETEGHFDKLYQKGFKRIELTDGYDYGKYMTYE